MIDGRIFTMKEVIMFELAACPHCKRAKKWMEELIAEYPEFGTVEVKHIDEGLQAQLASQYDYFYVPSYYVDGVKVHEGAATKEKILDVYRSAL